MKSLSDGNWRIASPWRLRNDGCHLLAYQCHTGDHIFKVLASLEASLAVFLDGSLNDAELAELWRNMHADTLSDPDAALELLLRGLAERDHIASRQGTLSPSFALARESLLPDFSQYRGANLRLELPFSISICLTNKCCTDCLYCYAERIRVHELSRHEWQKVFDDLVDNQVYVVDLAGADTLARADWFELMEDMVARDFVFFLSTKCHITKSVAQKLADLGVGKDGLPPHLMRTLQISVDSPDPVIAGKLVGRKGYLARAIDSVRNAISAGLNPRIKSVLTSINADAPLGLVDLFHPMGVREFQFVQYGISYYQPREDLFLSPEQKARLPEILQSLKDKYPDITVTVQEDLSTGGPGNRTYEEWLDRSICSGGRSNLQVKANGEVTLCDQIPHGDPFVVGNILEEGLQRVWNSERIKDFLYPPKEAFSGTVCGTCSEYDLCHDHKGYCYRDSLFAYDTIYEAPPDCPYQTRVGQRQI